MKLGIGTYAYAWAIGVPQYIPAHPMTATAFLERVASLGVRVAQIADNLPLHTLSPDELDALEAQAQALNIRIEVGTRGIAPDHLNTYRALALRFNSPILRVVVDTATHHPSPDEIVALLRPQMPDFERNGITMAIENHDRFKVTVLADIIDRVGSPNVGICLDTVNSFGSLEGPAVVVATLGPHVVNLHVKDFSIRRHDHNMGFTLTGTPAGSGQLDLPWLLAELGQHGRDFNAILELWPAPEATIDATIAKEDAWAVDSVAYLRTLISD